MVVNANGQLGTTTAPSAAAMLAVIQQQQKELDALRREVAAMRR